MVFSIGTDGDNPKVYNKYIRAKKYHEVVLGVKLVKEMSKLYLEQKEHK
jgi:hypothetical protein